MSTGNPQPIAQQLGLSISLAVFDVDGVFTDGQLVYQSDGSESKHFFVQDGLGIKLLAQNGIKTAIITGRTVTAVQNRANDLGIDYVIQGRDDKLVALKELMQKAGVSQQQVSYMGDDLPDLSAIEYAQLGASVINGDALVQSTADWVSSKAGGHGAVREFCEALLASQNKLQSIHDSYRMK